MSTQDEIDEETYILRQSVLETKDKKHKEKYCLRDFSGDVFELTSDMLVNKREEEATEKMELTGVAECILHKYAKLLSIAK